MRTKPAKMLPMSGCASILAMAAMAACGGGQEKASVDGMMTVSTASVFGSDMVITKSPRSRGEGDARRDGGTPKELSTPVMPESFEDTAPLATPVVAVDPVALQVAAVTATRAELTTPTTPTTPTILEPVSAPIVAAMPQVVVSQPAVAPTPTDTTSDFRKIAAENQTFLVSAPQTVRYGTASRWITKVVSGTVQCSNTFFGGDPAAGVVKHCESSAPAQYFSAPAEKFAPVPSSGPPIVAGAPYVNVNKIPLGSTGVSVDMLRATTEVAAASDMGSFRTVCDYSHMAFDDPIVYPGQPGKSHLHAFFGNTGTNAISTSESLHTTGNSTCRGGTVNRSGYWVPAVIDTRDGTPVKPRILIVYYKNGSFVDPKGVQAFPPGLRMIAGNAGASAPVQWGPSTYSCNGQGGNSDSIPNCAPGEEVWTTINFPNCWDGKNLDSPDHKSHMTYWPIPNPHGGKCPPSHPVSVPQVTFQALYPVTEKDAPLHWRLASDTYDPKLPAGYSMHGDWFNGWKPDIMDAWVKNCNQLSRDCGAHLLGDGRMMFW